MEEKKAKALLAKYVAGECNPEEKAKLESWYVQHDHKNIADLGETERLSDMNEIRNLLLKETRQPVKYRRLWPRVAAAASILLCLGIGLYFYQRNKPKPTNPQIAKNDIAPGSNKATLTLANGQKIILTKGLNGQLAQQGNMLVKVNSGNNIAYTAAANVNTTARTITYNTLATAKGEQSPYPLILADGSKVWLNAESSITFPTAFNGKERIVKITGEAFFEVVHNEKQSFKVLASGQTIEDIGTAFDVNAYTDELGTRTTLIEGSIKVNNMLLKPGEQTDGKQVTNANIAQVLAWKDGKFRFTNDNIQTVMRQLARWYDIDVSYTSTANNEGFNAKISRDQNISVILSALERTNGVRFKIEGRRVTVIQ